MISQRRGYSFSECETRLVELLGNPRRVPKDAGQAVVRVVIDEPTGK
jgi:hypothetical protein